MSDFTLDEERTGRIGFGEAGFCAGKSVAQIAAIISAASVPMLLTRLDEAQFAGLSAAQQDLPRRHPDDLPVREAPGEHLGGVAERACESSPATNAPRARFAR